MVTLQVSAVMTEARAAVEASHRLLDEMRMLRRQVKQNLTAVQNSAAMLALNMSATVSATAITVISTAYPVASTAEPILLESQAAVAGAPEPAFPNVNAPGPLPLDSPRPLVLDPKDQTGLDLLTPREMEVLRLIGEGQRTKEIAFTLGITFKTAVTHRSNIMEKLGIHEAPRLVRFAIRTGIVTA